MSAVLARIMARYLAGALLAYGVIDPAMAEQMMLDPDIALVLGALVAALAEAAYALALRQGWQR